MFTVTYETITPESAESGDAAARGYLTAEGWKVDEPSPMPLRRAVYLLGLCENAGRWWTETDGRCDARTGEYEFRALHPPEGISDSSRARVGRMIGA